MDERPDSPSDDAASGDLAASQRPIPPGALSGRSEQDGDQVTLTLRGELDLATAPVVEELLREAQSSDTKAILLDLRGLEFIDSTGIRVLVTAYRRAPDAGRLRRTRSTPAVERTLKLAGLDDFLPPTG
jgi:anti-sigma B factor antagonist